MQQCPVAMQGKQETEDASASLAGFYKFTVHNVKELELLLMQNRWGLDTAVSMRLASRIGASCMLARLHVAILSHLGLWCRKYAAEIAHSVSSVKRKAIVDRANEVGCHTTRSCRRLCWKSHRWPLGGMESKSQTESSVAQWMSQLDFTVCSCCPAKFQIRKIQVAEDESASIMM